MLDTNPILFRELVRAARQRQTFLLRLLAPVAVTLAVLWLWYRTGARAFEQSLSGEGAETL